MDSTGGDKPSQGTDSPAQETPSKPQKYWMNRFILTNFVVLLLALIAAYLEYVAYPSLMTNTFGESNISLHLSFLTYRYNSINYQGEHLIGIPAFDFFQALIYVLIIMNIVHFLENRKS